MVGPWMRGWCGRWAALALAALTLAMPAAGQAFLDRIKQRGQVTIGYRVDSPPFSYLDAVGNPIGYGLDLCQPIALRLATEAGLESPAVRYLPVDVHQVVRYVKEGNVDLMCTATSATSQRLEVISFSPTIFVASVKVLARREDGFNALAQLDGKAIGVIDRTTAAKAVADHARKNSMSFSVPRLVGPEAALRLLRLGWIAGYARDDVLLAVQTAGLPDAAGFHLLPESLSSEDIAIAFAKNDPQLAQIVSEMLANLNRSGQWGAIYERWFLKPIAPANQTLNLPMSGALRHAMEKML